VSNRKFVGFQYASRGNAPSATEGILKWGEFVRKKERERKREIKGEAYNFHAKVHTAKRDLRGGSIPLKGSLLNVDGTSF